MSEEIKDTGRYYVEVQEGYLNGESFEIGTKGLTVGRALDCNVVLADKSISRHHARFYVKDGYCYVDDMGSRNGFTVRGERTQHQCLRNGDLVDLGYCKFVFHSEGTLRERATSDEIVEEVKEWEEAAKQPREVLRLPLHPYAIIAPLFGVATFLFWGFAFGAVVLAAVALVEIYRKGQHRGTPLAIGGVALAAVGAAWSLWFTGAGPSLPPEAGPSAEKCRENLVHIADALQRYADKNEGRYPKSLEELYPAYVRTKERLSCPGVRSDAEAGMSYAFPAAGRENLPGDAVAVCDSSADNHEGSGGLVLRVNGQIEWLSARELQHVLAEVKER